MLKTMLLTIKLTNTEDSLYPSYETVDWQSLSIYAHDLDITLRNHEEAYRMLGIAFYEMPVSIRELCAQDNDQALVLCRAGFTMPSAFEDSTKTPQVMLDLATLRRARDTALRHLRKAASRYLPSEAAKMQADLTQAEIAMSSAQSVHERLAVALKALREGVGKHQELKDHLASMGCSQPSASLPTMASNFNDYLELRAWALSLPEVQEMIRLGRTAESIMSEMTLHDRRPIEPEAEGHAGNAQTPSWIRTTFAESDDDTPAPTKHSNTFEFPEFSDSTSESGDSDTAEEEAASPSDDRWEIARTLKSPRIGKRMEK